MYYARIMQLGLFSLQVQTISNSDVNLENLQKKK